MANKVGAPLNNKNPERWTIEEANKLFDKVEAMLYDECEYLVSGKKIKGFKYHYLGEIATDRNIRLYSDLFLYLKNKFKELVPRYNSIKATLEANCFSDSKKGIINTATAIMNLKSNYGWTDRLDNTSKGDKMHSPPSIVFIDTDAD